MTAPTAGGITVRRCVVRVIRRGGWSWGPDPRDLVRQAVNALPDLLADRFADQLAGDGPDVEITEPVRLTIRLDRGRGQGRSPLAALVVEPTTDQDLVTPAVNGTATHQSTVDMKSVGATEPGPGARPSTPAVLFAELAERGELAPLLALLPDDSLLAYLIAVFAEHTGAPSPATDLGSAALVAEYARRHPATPLPTTGDEQRALVRTLLAPADTDGSPPRPDTASPATTRTSARLPADVPVGETRSCSVLPFLLAGPLARIGYLDAIGPALAGVDQLAQAPLFAAALAYQVLAAPERGWRRTGQAAEAAATFAGLAEVPDLGDFAQRVRPALPVLDAVRALSLCRGHDPADPLLVTGVDGGLLLVDALGLFPIALAPDVAGLLPHWVACGRPDVVVCASPLPPSCLRDLAAEGVALVTDVRPLRGDPLVRVPRPTPLWTAGRPDPRLAADLPAHAARLAEVVAALLTTRRAVPRAGDGALDRSAALAAALSLGLISWTLWRERETPTPVLAMTRFADLEATVRFTPDAVRVRVPLGRRHADLLRCGALTDVQDVVWLGGRTLTFSGG
ncbi:hypothetical protein [Actinophytocola sediminis]